MKNALIYFYNINLEKLTKINYNYYFYHNNYNYVISKYDRNINEALSIYELNKEMISHGYKTYVIILTINNDIIFNFENTYYILMKMPNIKNRIINFNDIISFKYNVNNASIIKALDKSNWSYHWENKIDTLENKIITVKNKYTNLNNSINYYIGLWENGIAYFNDNVDKNNIEKVVAHKRVGVNTDLLEFYNPLNLIIDCKERDISEYLKSMVINNNVTDDLIYMYLSKIHINRNSAILLITRTLFPSNYFDNVEKILYETYDDVEILEYDKKQNNEKTLLKIMFKCYYKFNIPLIDWIIRD